MSSTTIALLIFACVFSGALLGLYLRAIVPEATAHCIGSGMDPRVKSEDDEWKNGRATAGDSDRHSRHGNRRRFGVDLAVAEQRQLAHALRLVSHGYSSPT